MAVRALHSATQKAFSLLCQSLLSSLSHRSRPLSLSSSHPSFPPPHSQSSSQPQSPPCPPPFQPPPRPTPDDINEICRILSDFRAPHHDIELALTPFSPKISNNLVEQVLKRTKNLGFSAYRFFLWAKRFPGFQPTMTSYRILIGILGGGKQFPLIWDLLLEVRDRESLELCPDVFWVIFGFYCRANLPQDAIRAFGRMVDFGIRPRIDDLHHLLYVLCKRKFAKEAQEFFDKVKFDFEPSDKSYSILIRGWGVIGESGIAREVFDEMLNRGCVVDILAFNSLLEALCKGGNVDEAYRLFREMGSRGLSRDACTYSIFIRAYCEGNDIYSAFRVLDRMRRYDIVPNVFTYNCIIKKLCVNEKVEEAYLLLDEMIQRGVNPDIWSYNTILAFHCHHCEVNRALRLIDRMERETCMPDRHTYNMLLKMLIRVGRFDRVKELWDSMDTRGFYPPVSTYAVMIHGFLKKRGKVEEACKFFEIMIDEGIPPYYSTCVLLKNRLVGLGFLEQINVLADKMERSSSCSIQELAKTVRRERVGRRSRREASMEGSEDEWELGSGTDWLT